MDRLTCFPQCAWIFVMAALYEVGGSDLVSTPAALASFRRSRPPHRRRRFSFWSSSLTPSEVTRRSVCSSHSSKMTSYLAGSVPRTQGLPAVARPASKLCVILVASVKTSSAHTLFTGWRPTYASGKGTYVNALHSPDTTSTQTNFRKKWQKVPQSPLPTYSKELIYLYFPAFSKWSGRPQWRS